MKLPKHLLATPIILGVMILSNSSSFAHNGKLAKAYPLGPIVIDGNFSEWPASATRYNLNTPHSDTKPINGADFNGFFQVGYRLDNQSFYLAITVYDDDFIEDTSANVQWSSQDGLELYVDGTHLQAGSGVASFMYSKKLRNINKAFYDAFAAKAGWEIMEVVMVAKEKVRYYEWRIALGRHLEVGRSLGLDMMLFDRDSDGSFSFAAWGKGGAKYLNPDGLGDVLILPAKSTMSSVSGNIRWDRPTKAELPGAIKFFSLSGKNLWFETELDSAGNYTVELPSGKYELSLRQPYFYTNDSLYSGAFDKPVTIEVKPKKNAKVPEIRISAVAVPDLIPEKGILHEFNEESVRKVDEFIEAYRKYYNIPGVSLALVKDGRMVYHNTYGVKNSFTEQKVQDNTLFEAASITKPVFAYAVQRLAERGEIDLDKPLYQYLPNPDIEYDERYKLITAKHVLTHRTGFPNWRSMNPDGKLDIKFTPGTGYGYSGEGFEYLKKVVEKITGKKVEQVLQEEVIQPMGLYHTFFSENDSLRQLVANGHYNGLPTNVDLPKEPGMAFSMHTEAAIFTRFILFLSEQKGLTKDSYARMFSKQSEFNYDPEDKKPESPAYMGMSLEIRETPFGKSFGHGGNNGDFKCQFEMYNEKGMGYVIFTNSNTSDFLLMAMRKLLIEGR
jgi:CubicO group peptidase (beta-lactamase class C family)